jgi:hypothetical protein
MWDFTGDAIMLRIQRMDDREVVPLVQEPASLLPAGGALSSMRLPTEKDGRRARGNQRFALIAT